MTLPIYKSGEPLFIIILRDPDAKAKLTKWTQTSRSIQAKVEENRLQIFDPNTLSLFVLNWTHGWDNIMVWDTYLRRHLYF